jgi:hypothetical protein
MNPLGRWRVPTRETTQKSRARTIGNQHVVGVSERASAGSKLSRWPAAGSAVSSSGPQVDPNLERPCSLEAGTNETVSAWRGLVEFVAVVAGAVGATVVLTAPLAFEADHVGRLDNFDGQFSIWNVAWVARTIVAKPWSVFDANIFFPARNTLAFSEHNLGAGVLAAPLYWATGNPYLTHNVVLLLSFVLSLIGTYYLARHLTGDRYGASAAALAFGLCPYVFARTPHIQLMMTAGLPIGLLAWHRLVERLSVTRALTVGVAIVAQALFCGYYGVFLVVIITLSAAVYAVQHGRVRDGRFWVMHGVAFVVVGIVLMPLFMRYLEVRHAGFRRTLEDAAIFSADWRAYFASGVPAHVWILSHLSGWAEVLFPGVISTTATVATMMGTLCFRKRRSREDQHIIALYGIVSVAAVWLSFGPRAGLYGWVYAVFPAMQWLRAPSRFGVVVALGFAILTAFAVQDLRRSVRYGGVLGLLVIAVTAYELATPLRFLTVPPTAGVYRLLARLPPGPVVEFPYFSRREDVFKHSSYMLRSTAHWKPLINGYSDFLPAGFLDEARTIVEFPRAEAVHVLQARGARYAVIHLAEFADGGSDMRARLSTIGPPLRPLVHIGTDYLYELAPRAESPGDPERVLDEPEAPTPTDLARP